MTRRTRLVSTLLTAALALPTLGACLAEEMTPYEASQSWHPVTPADDPPEGVTVMKGRLWVLMNPIIVPKFNTYNSGGPRVDVAFWHCGSEPVTVLDVRVEGSAAFTKGKLPLPGKPKIIDAGRWGTTIHYDPAVGGPDTAELVIETAEPSSPSLRVPIIYDPECDADFVFDPDTDPTAFPDYVHEPRGFLHVDPNPVRMRKSKPGSTVQVSIVKHNTEPVRVSRIVALGPHVKIVRADGTLVTGNALPGPIELGWYDEVLTVGLVYDPEEGQPEGDDTLVLGFDDLDGHEYELHVPILVR